MFNSIKDVGKNSAFLILGVIGVVIIAALAMNGNNAGFLNFGGPSNDELAQKALNYLNTSVLDSQSQAILVSTSDESGLVKIKISVAGNEYDSYITKDGKLLFPQAFNMEPGSTDTTGQDSEGTDQSSSVTPDTIVKTDKPLVEAYVVTRCPFGLQMQRVLADAIKSVPALAQNIKVRYMGGIAGNTVTSMHGDEEAQENLRQICLREEQASKYWDYVSCQMRSGDTAGCEKPSGVDSAKLSACVSDTLRGVAYAKEDFDLNAKYNVTGSPTLVYNNEQISEFNFGGRSSDAIKQIVCNASSSPSAFCSQMLNTATAAASFSETYSSSTASSGTAASNCAPAE